jgi:hypothetical protein
VAALPTPFDRSLEVRAADGIRVAGCLVLDHSVELGAVEVDMLLTAAEPAIAAVTVATSNAGELLRFEVGRGGTSITAADGSSINAAGIAPDDWVRLRLAARSGGYEATIEPRLKGDRPERLGLDTGARGSIDEICLELLGPRGATVHYDNLTIDSQ